MAKQGTILILTQVYVPDSASVGQHMHDTAVELAQRGHRVVVLTSARGYDDPSMKNPLRELRDGVEIRRLPLASFGKSSIPIRLMGATLFLLQAFVRGLFVRGLRGTLVSTSPPMCTIVAWLLALVRRAPYTFWVMDINPDQAVILGKVKEDGLLVRMFEAFNRRSLKRATRVVVLDRLMAERMNRKLDTSDKMEIIPPWTMLPPTEPVLHSENPFRREHGLTDKLVFMYSGNHSVAHPIGTILAAARRLEAREDLVFMFIGGGLGKRDVDEAVENGATNVRSLPYQPLEELQWSLSAADIHLVTFSEEMVGVVHPCKAYGALAASRPILLVGPRESHIGNLIDEYQVGWSVERDQVDEMVQLVEEIAGGQAGDLEAMGRGGLEAIRKSLSPEVLRGRLCDVIEEGLAG
ncbi:MAG: glycosyltransferase family 4 protein [Planctomycetota bacterium]|nr:glycosyltransferase family 4 protein [Planctomycetota bacterium]